MLEGVIPLETFPLVEWHKGELADVPSFTVLKPQICVTRPQCVNKERDIILVYIKQVYHDAGYGECEKFISLTL